MIIRNATAADIAAIYKINQDNVPHVGSVDIGWFECYLLRAHYFRVVEVENQIVGFMIAMLPATEYSSENFLWFKNNYNSFVYVDRIAISSKYIGKGLGKNLYQDLEKENPSLLITCEVNIDPPNPSSLQFHKNLGFRELGTLVTKGGLVTVSLLGKTV